MYHNYNTFFVIREILRGHTKEKTALHTLQHQGKKTPAYGSGTIKRRNNNYIIEVAHLNCHFWPEKAISANKSVTSIQFCYIFHLRVMLSG